MMKLSMSTISTMNNSLILLLTAGHLCFRMVIYQLTTCYFANAMMKLGMSAVLAIKNSLIIFSTTGHLCFQMVILYQLCYLMKLIKGTKPTMMGFIDYTFVHWSIMFWNGHFTGIWVLYWP